MLFANLKRIFSAGRNWKNEVTNGDNVQILLYQFGAKRLLFFMRYDNLITDFIVLLLE